MPSLPKPSPRRDWAIAVAIACGLISCDRRADPLAEPAAPQPPTLKELIASLTIDEQAFKDMPFRDVVEATTGHQVIPFDPSQPSDAEILTAIEEALDECFQRLNRDDSPTSDESRINEVSSHFEAALLELLNETPGISCGRPPTASGKVQSSGYPDLRIVHEATGQVVYLDPKLVARGSFDSAFRSFYFTPRVETNKVLDDACHLLVGIEHDAATGAWKFLRWHLVDLYGFRVQLKAEFQSGNRDLYQPDQIITSGGAGE
jgi:hypothetical protein